MESKNWIYAGIEFLLCISGLALWIVSAIVIVSIRHFQQFHYFKYILIPVVVLIVIANISFMAGIFKWRAMYTDKVAYLVGFIILYVLLIVLLISAVVLTVVYRGKIEHSVENETLDAINKYKSNENVTDCFSSQVDLFQTTLQCCGSNGSSNWFSTSWGLAHIGSVPHSCCSNVTACPQGAVDVKRYQEYISKDGCYKKISDILDQNLTYILVAAIVYLALMVSFVAIICTVQSDIVGWLLK